MLAKTDSVKIPTITPSEATIGIGKKCDRSILTPTKNKITEIPYLRYGNLPAIPDSKKYSERKPIMAKMLDE